ncbi:MAG: DUF559 domain-containing protein [Bacteroidales bacterium]|nr:DUF559 domain-containing protein [Bacteroidales bacterium]
MKRKIIPYNPKLKNLARKLRNNSTKSEIILWKHLKGKQMHGYDFHRQKPIDNYIADFFCHELMLVIELDGYTHQFDEVIKKDKIKSSRLKELGIKVLRFPDGEVYNNIDNVLKTIEKYIMKLEKHTPNPSQEGEKTKSKNLKIKVCGMRDKENIKQLCELQPDYIGFIFYPKSKRYAGEKINPGILKAIPGNIIKTGVFVNEKFEKIQECAIMNLLGAVQLHGEETPELCNQLKEAGLIVLKAFRISSSFDFKQLEPYKKSINYFLFDTYTEQYGGSGQKFNWDILRNYDNEIPVFLSGGISPDDAKKIQSMNWLNIYALDINSKFEIEPALKDIEKLKTFIKTIRYE